MKKGGRKEERKGEREDSRKGGREDRRREGGRKDEMGKEVWEKEWNKGREKGER